MIRKPFRPRPVIGVAISANAIYAVRTRGAHHGSADTWSGTLASPVPGTGEWPALAAAINEMRAHFGPRCTVNVSLVPPLARTRRIELPRISSREAEAVLTRDAARYFAAAAEPHVVSLHGVRAEGGGKAWIVTAVPNGILESIEAAVAAVGWQLSRVEPGWVALQTHVRRTYARRKWPDWLLMCDEAHVHLVRFRGDRVADVRLARYGTLPAIEPGSRVLVTGPVSQQSDTLLENLSRHCSVVRDLSHVENSSQAIAELAASSSHRVRGPQILSGARRKARRAAAARSGRLYLSAAMALVLASIAVDTWGARRELDVIRRERERLRPAVAAALASGARLDSVGNRVRQLDSLRTGGTRWTEAVAETARQLPLDTYLTRLRGQSDTLVLSGYTRSPQAALHALVQSPLYAAVRFTAPLEEMSGPDHVLQRFRLGMVIRRETL